MHVKAVIAALAHACYKPPGMDYADVLLETTHACKTRKCDADRSAL
jgi:hypothetical protein